MSCRHEPWIDRDRAMIDTLNSLGIEKGKPFDPSDTTKARLNSRRRRRPVPGWRRNTTPACHRSSHRASRWTVPAPPELGQGSAVGLRGSEPVPARHPRHRYSQRVHRHEAARRGQMYAISIRDKDGDAFDGGRTVSPDGAAEEPVEQYWSVTAYDRQTHALIRNWRARAGRRDAADVKKNSDGSVDLYFGPKAPSGRTRTGCRLTPSGSSNRWRASTRRGRSSSRRRRCCRMWRR